MSNQAGNQRKVILGDEYDDSLREALMNVLKEFGGEVQSQNWGVGGSQEIETIDVDVNGSPLRIESETYVGLSIRGECSLVDQITSILARRLGKK
jgi:hypothetical protein